MSEKMNALNQAEKLTRLIAESPGLLLYFYNDQCMPCISLRPKVDELLINKFPKMEIVFVNVGELPEISAVYGVFSSPTIILFFEGKENRRFSKFMSVSELEKIIGRYYQMIFL